MSEIPAGDPTMLLFMRHTLATLAYRAGKTLRGTDAVFGAYQVTPNSPSCLEIVAHMGDLMDWVLRQVRGEWRWTTAPRQSWDAEVARFFAALAILDAQLATGVPLGHDPGVIFQGGIADALTHTGQL